MGQNVLEFTFLMASTKTCIFFFLSNLHTFYNLSPTKDPTYSDLRYIFFRDILVHHCHNENENMKLYIPMICKIRQKTNMAHSYPKGHEHHKTNEAKSLWGVYCP